MAVAYKLLDHTDEETPGVWTPDDTVNQEIICGSLLLRKAT
jgi:hypothetical protein